MSTSHTHPSPFSKPIRVFLTDLIHDWPGPILDPYAGVGGVHKLGRDDTYGVEIEQEWAELSRFTAWGDSATIRTHDDDCVVTSPLSRWTTRDIRFPRPRAIVTSPDYGNRFADQYLGTPAEVAERAATGKAPRRRSYAISLNRAVSVGSGAGFYFWTDEYKDLHTNVMRAVTDVVVRPGLGAFNVSDVIHDKTVHPVTMWWQGMLQGLGWQFKDAHPIGTHRYKDGANRDARVANEWVVVMALPETSREHGRAG